MASKIVMGTFRVPRQDFEAFKKSAAARGLSASALLRRLVSAIVELDPLAEVKLHERPEVPDDRE